MSIGKRAIKDLAEEILQEFTNCYSEADKDVLVKMMYNAICCEKNDGEDWHRIAELNVRRIMELEAERDGARRDCAVAEKNHAQALEDAEKMKNTAEIVMNYAVIFTYSFDSEVSVYLFQGEEEAKRFLKQNFEQEVRIDTEENGWEIESYISDDGCYAKISSNFDDGDNPIDITEMRIGNIYQ